MTIEVNVNHALSVSVGLIGTLGVFFGSAAVSEAAFDQSHGAALAVCLIFMCLSLFLILCGYGLYVP